MKCSPSVTFFLATISAIVQAAQAIGSYKSYKRTVMDGFELTGSLLGNYSRDGLTLVGCGSLCAKFSCVAYSFRRRGSIGVCKIGMNPYQKKPRKRSKVYYLIDDSNPNASDGFKYTQYAISRKFDDARSYCLAIGVDHGDMALTYPSQVTYRQVVKLNTSILSEDAHVDLQRLGPYTQRQFISGVGEIMDARPSKKTPLQHWGPVEPNANSDAEGSRVSLDLDKGSHNDIWETAYLPSRVVCSNDTSSYRYLRGTGKYYKLVWSPHATYLEASRNCKADGGRLAQTYGVNGTFAVLDAYSNVELYRFWVGGTNIGTGSSNIWAFEDGTTINSANKTADSGRQKWYGAEPTGALYANCMTVYIGYQFSQLCYESWKYLCERDYA